MQLKLPTHAGKTIKWGNLQGSSKAYGLICAAAEHDGPLLVLTENSLAANRLYYELKFFQQSQHDWPIWLFPDWEILAYDLFSPHQDIISERLKILYHLPQLNKGIILAPITTVMAQLCPSEYLHGHSLIVDTGSKFDLEAMRLKFTNAGYRSVTQVMEHGEFAIRGSIVDIFPMGSDQPLRIDLFDDEVDSIREFDPETQRSTNKIDAINLLPAKEYPLTETGIQNFRQNWRQKFAGDPSKSAIYQDVSQGLAHAGIEFYLPLFFEQTEALTAYLDPNTLICSIENTDTAMSEYWQDVQNRYRLRAIDIQRPILAPKELFLSPDELKQRLAQYRRLHLSTAPLASTSALATNYTTESLPELKTDPARPHPFVATIRIPATKT